MQTEKFQMHKLGLEKAEKSFKKNKKQPTFFGWQRKQGGSRETSTSVSVTTQNPFTVWITTNSGQFWKRYEYQTTSPVSWETYMNFKKQ